MWAILIGSLIGALAQAMGSLVGRALLALGVGFVTFSGFSLLGDWVFALIQSNVSALPAEISSFVAWLWVDKALSLVMSAWTAALAIKTAGGADLTRMVIRK